MSSSGGKLVGGARWHEYGIPAMPAYQWLELRGWQVVVADEARELARALLEAADAIERGSA